MLTKVSPSGYFGKRLVPGFEVRVDRALCKHHRWMLAALNLGAVVLGVAAGCLTSTIVTLALGLGLGLVGVDGAAGIALVVGIAAGLVTGGYLAGRRAVHSERFHGMITGLLITFVLVIGARLQGSEAPVTSVLWLAVLSIAIAGLAGWLAGRRKTTRTES